MAAPTSTAVPRSAFAWVLEPSGSTEAQTVYLTTDSGIYVLLQLAYSSMNSWSPSLQITARVYMPDGSKKLHNSNLSASTLKLTDERLSASGGPLSIKLVSDESASGVKPTYRISLSAAPEMVIEVDLVATVEAFQIGDGKRFFIPGTPSSGYISSRFVPKAKVTGKIVLGGTTHDAAGQGVFTHAIQTPPQNVARWNFANFQNEKDALMLYQYELPKNGKYPQGLVSQGSLVLDGELVAVMEDNHSEFGGVVYDEFSKYKIPTSVTHVLRGRTRSDKSVVVTLRLGLGRLLDKIDVLGELPFLIRKIIQTFITAPFVYQWAEDAEVVVEIDGVSRRLSGHAFHENTFLSELS